MRKKRSAKKYIATLSKQKQSYLHEIEILTRELMHPETEWSEIPFANENEAYDVLKSIAYININKLPGSNTSSDEEIETISSRIKTLC